MSVVSSMISVVSIAFSLNLSVLFKVVNLGRSQHRKHVQDEATPCMNPPNAEENCDLLTRNAKRDKFLCRAKKNRFVFSFWVVSPVMYVAVAVGWLLCGMKYLRPVSKCQSIISPESTTI